MSSFDESSFYFREFSGRVRLFPLPNLVLFPRIMQPLHVFERRYRDLVEEAIAGDGLIAMATLAPGWERNYEGRPALYPTACLGRIVAHCRLAGGDYNLLLLGLRRVRVLHELDPVRRFREAEVALCEDIYSACPLSRQRRLQREFRNALLRFLPERQEVQEQLDQLMGRDVPLGLLTDVIGYMTEMSVGSKQLLLAEADVYRRAELLLSCLSRKAVPASADGAEPSAIYFPPQFSTN
jgi:uncharacterized protein